MMEVIIVLYRAGWLHWGLVRFRGFGAGRWRLWNIYTTRQDALSGILNVTDKYGPGNYDVLAAVRTNWDDLYKGVLAFPKIIPPQGGSGTAPVLAPRCGSQMSTPQWPPVGSPTVDELRKLADQLRPYLRIVMCQATTCFEGKIYRCGLDDNHPGQHQCSKGKWEGDYLRPGQILPTPDDYEMGGG